MANEVRDAILELMEERKLRQKDLHARTKLGRTTIHRHLTGETEPNPEQRVVYAEAFGVTPAEFEERWRRKLVAAPTLTPAEQAKLAGLASAHEIPPSELIDAVERALASGTWKLPKPRAGAGHDQRFKRAAKGRADQQSNEGTK